LTVFLGHFGHHRRASTRLAWSTQGLWLFVISGYWLDRHRVAILQW
jgi:hypothetical protein